MADKSTNAVSDFLGVFGVGRITVYGIWRLSALTTTRQILVSSSSSATVFWPSKLPPDLVHNGEDGSKDCQEIPLGGRGWTFQRRIHRFNDDEDGM